MSCQRHELKQLQGTTIIRGREIQSCAQYYIALTNVATHYPVPDGAEGNGYSCAMWASCTRSLMIFSIFRSRKISNFGAFLDVAEGPCK